MCLLTNFNDMYNDGQVLLVNGKAFVIDLGSLNFLYDTFGGEKWIDGQWWYYLSTRNGDSNYEVLYTRPTKQLCGVNYIFKIV